jgi:hypothetical protein
MHVNNFDGGYYVPDGNIYNANDNEAFKFTIPEIATTMEGYNIIGWTTIEGSKNVKYRAGDTLSLNYGLSESLYAVYNKYAVTYTVNLYDTEDYVYDYVYENNYGNINWQLVDTLTATSAEDFYTFTLPEKTSLRGTYIMGWCQSFYEPRFTITLSKWDNTINLYAKARDNYRIYMHIVDGYGEYWAPNEIIYNPNSNYYFTIPEIETTMEGYDIIGWSTTPGYNVAQYSAGDTIYLNYGLSESLYAVYNDEYHYTLEITDPNGGEQVVILSARTTANTYTFTLPQINGYCLDQMWDDGTATKYYSGNTITLNARGRFTHKQLWLLNE